MDGFEEPTGFLLGTRALMEYQLGNFSQARTFMEAHLREF